MDFVQGPILQSLGDPQPTTLEGKHVAPRTQLVLAWGSATTVNRICSKRGCMQTTTAEGFHS